jgi:hypothetical protein
VNDFINLSNSGYLNPVNEITMSAWVKPTSSGTQFIISKSPTTDQYFCRLQAGSVIRMAINSNFLTSVNTFAPGNWMHVVCTYNTTDMMIYVNGSLFAGPQSLSTTMSDNGEDVLIGINNNLALPFNGSIDEPRIYNRSLSSDEINLLYRTNLRKYDTDKWQLSFNQSGNFDLQYKIEGSRNDTIGFIKSDISNYSLYVNKSSLSVGKYTYYASAKDISGNENLTQPWEITISDDTTNPDINFTMPPTPANGTTTQNTSIEINVSITNEPNLDEFKWNWNGTNYTLYNDSLVLMYNFDNVSALGENDSHVVDLSGYENNGTFSDNVSRDDGTDGVNGPNMTDGRYAGGLMVIILI